jgi:hypothetical protein
VRVQKGIAAVAPRFNILPTTAPEEFQAHHVTVAADASNGQKFNPGLYS